MTNNSELEELSAEIFHISADNQNFDYGLNTELLTKSDRLLFIDPTVADYQILIDNLSQPAEVVILDAELDGITQITDSLSNYDDLDAVHIVSHGDAGKLFLGSTVLERDTLSEYADELGSWGDSLTETGDILLYGCDVASNLAGVEFVKDLSQYTNADILASDDLTGSSELGGDWYLEYATGEIEAEIIFDAEVWEAYEYVFDYIYIPPVNSNGSYFNDKTFTNVITLPGVDNNFRDPFRVDFYRVINAPDLRDLNVSEPNFLDIDSSFFETDFRLNYTPINSGVIDNFDDNPDLSIIDFPQTENQPFILNFGNFRLTPGASYDYDDPFINHLVFPFDASFLNFNAVNFEFTSISANEFGTIDSAHDSITFKFDAGTFDFSSLTDESSLSFELSKRNFDRYDIQYDNIVRISDNFLFDATAVTFRSDSITFDYKPDTFYFNPGLFAANANLYEYKLSTADFNAGVSFEQFNASDYRALDYAFEGDELFDSNHYLNQGVTPNGMNLFTDYVENG